MAAPVAAREPDAVIAVWPDEPPGYQIESGPERDTTKPGDRLIEGKPVVRLGHVAKPTLSVYRPAADRANGAAVVICPGGGFHILAWDLEGTEVAEWLNTLGITGIVLKYRVPTRSFDPYWLPPVQDAQRAVSVVRSRAAEWKLDVERIGVLGFSAGGGIAARVGLESSGRQYEAVDAVDEQPCQADFAILVYPGAIVDRESRQLEDDVQVTENAAPMFFVHAFDDGVPLENSLELAKALKRVKVPAEVHVYSQGGHGYGLRPGKLPVTTWPSRCAEWLEVEGFLSAGGK